AEGASSARLVVPDSAGFGGLVHVDEAAGLVYFVDKSDPTQRHLARVSFKTPDARPERLTEEVGIHSATFAKNGSLYVHRHTGPRSLGTSTVRAADGKELGTLPSVALPPPHWPTTEFLTIGSDPELRASITRPRRFEPGRKYPVIVQVYGGPTVQTVQQSAGSHFLHQWYADHGFIVVAIDNRGTPGRGRNWERSIYGDFGQLPLADQVEGLRLLGERFPELDLSRVGIKGWSFGGYMSALAVLKRPDVFHAAVAGAPVSDWEDYDTHYTERYLGLPKDNAAGYKSSSLLPLAEKLMRPLLLVHGSADDNVYFIHSLKLADALFRHGQPFELLVMKNQTHGVRDPRLRERLEERTLRFFRQHLIEAPRSGPAAGQ
ncbi:MAG TPA: prolyl oligopeptidase family serine peptidase, partial [Gemmatales bacterium]|nr:prolyl oligopeptidase family serine peptidase [Gemmatales bacterium]